MTCGEMLRLLGDYVDGEIDPALCREFEAHLAGCNPCQMVIENVRRTITLYRSGEVFELPPEFSEKLHRALRDKWREAREGGTSGGASG